VIALGAQDEFDAQRTAQRYMQIAPYAVDDLAKSVNLADLAARNVALPPATT
jgi:hypothetical protein